MRDGRIARPCTDLTAMHDVVPTDPCSLETRTGVGPIDRCLSEHKMSLADDIKVRSYMAPHPSSSRLARTLVPYLPSSS